MVSGVGGVMVVVVWIMLTRLFSFVVFFNFYRLCVRFIFIFLSLITTHGVHTCSGGRTNF